MPQDGYTTQIVQVGRLQEPLQVAMARLYLQHYDGSCEALFRADLHAKDEVILLYHNAALVGFTSLLVYGAQWQGQAVRVVYSGDTIVARAHWGQQALAPAFITRLAHIRQAAPDQPLYWFLLVKGHRTYKYLAVFAERFYPHWAQQHPSLQALADQLAHARFGGDYDAASGVVRFAESRGHLKADIADPLPQELSKTAARFFMQRNPNYRQGHELVCLCEVRLDNLKPWAQRVFQRAWPQGAS